jgi:uronate dehydrogenase
MPPKKILITGAYGLIGNLSYGHLAQNPQDYDVYGLDRQPQPSRRLPQIKAHVIPSQKFFLADISDLAAVQHALQGIHTLVHLAADPDGREWESVLSNNIVGAYNIFEASRLAGVQRVIYASTNQVIFGYMKDDPYRLFLMGGSQELAPEDFPPIDHTRPLRPLSHYTCSKIFGESLAQMYAQVHNLSCICLRIGWVIDNDFPPTRWGRTVWCSHRDIVQLIERCINAPDSLRFDIFFGHSNNRYNLADIQHARDVLGYAPQDGAVEYME